MSAVVALENVSVRYDVGGGRVLQASRNVSLAIEPGQIVTVVGESGCGKSTVGKLVLGTQPPSDGTVRYDGTDVWAPGFRWTKDYRLMVQVVHQDSYASLNPVKTIGQTLSAPFLYHRLVGSRRQADEKVQALLQQVGLTPTDYFANKYPFQLSGGQRQRVSIARATILSPRLILTDEPVSGVDASLRLAILDLMRDLNRERGLAFLYITHDLATARYFGKGGRLVVMYLGAVVETGEVGAIIDTPRHPYLQALLAALPPMDPLQARTPKPLPLKSLDMPDPTRPPSGCAFHPRCPYAEAICAEQVPQLTPAPDAPDIQVACHLVAQGKRPGRGLSPAHVT